MLIEHRNTLVFRMFWGLWLSGIAVLSLLPAKVAITTGWSDKIEHGLAFAALAILWQLAWPKVRGLLIIALSVSYGAFIELAQTFSPGRHADVWDLLADAVGVGLGMFIIHGWKRRVWSQG